MLPFLLLLCCRVVVLSRCCVAAAAVVVVVVLIVVVVGAVALSLANPFLTEILFHPNPPPDFFDGHH